MRFFSDKPEDPGELRAEIEAVQEEENQVYNPEQPIVYGTPGEQKPDEKS